MIATDQIDPPQSNHIARPGYSKENQKYLINLGNKTGIIDKIRRQNVNVGRQYSSGG